MKINTLSKTVEVVPQTPLEKPAFQAATKGDSAISKTKIAKLIMRRDVDLVAPHKPKQGLISRLQIVQRMLILQILKAQIKDSVKDKLSLSINLESYRLISIVA